MSAVQWDTRHDTLVASNTDDLVAEPNRRITRTHDGVLHLVVHSDDPSGIEIGGDGDIARGVLVHRDDDVCDVRDDDDASTSSASSPSSSWRLGHTDPNVVDVELETTRERCDDDDATRSDDV